MTHKEQIKQMHERFLYPVVRIFSPEGAGSGTIIYSQPDPKHDGDHLTFVLTNHHVISKCIQYKNEWNSILKRQIQTEVCEAAKVEDFQYVNLSTVDSTNRYKADIVAYDKNHDLAILKMSSPRHFANVAPIIPRDKIRDVYCYDEVVVTGCSLAHEPISSFGRITFLNEDIDQRRYYMASAGMIFGNSGGALFLQETGELIGVPSRVTVKQMGFGLDVITWMGFSAHPERLYEFFEEQELQFLIDDNDDFYAAQERREQRKKESMIELKARAMQDSDEAA